MPKRSPVRWCSSSKGACDAGSSAAARRRIAAGGAPSCEVPPFEGVGDQLVVDLAFADAGVLATELDATLGVQTKPPLLLMEHAQEQDDRGLDLVVAVERLDVDLLQRSSGLSCCGPKVVDDQLAGQADCSSMPVVCPMRGPRHLCLVMRPVGQRTLLTVATPRDT